MMKNKKILVGVLFMSLLVLASCGPQKGASVESSNIENKSEKKEEHLDYKNQEEWDFEAGDAQSPINIETSTAVPMVDAGEITINYNDLVIDEVDNGHSIQIDDTGTAVINGLNFDLNQFHFHAKSEHTINSEYFPLEAHFVNKAQNGRLAVLAVLFKEGQANPAFETILQNIKKGEKATVSDPINTSQLFPTDFSYYHYLGSLTTPPLSENVEWYVMEHPVEVSKEQLKTFNTYYDGNNREIQPLNERIILKHENQ